MSEALRDRVFEATERIVRRERVGSARAAVASFLLGLYARDKRLTETDVEFELGALVEETLAAYEQLTGKKHRLVRGLYVRSGDKEIGPLSGVRLVADKIVAGRYIEGGVPQSHLDQQTLLRRNEYAGWGEPGRERTNYSSDVEVYAATARSDHYEVIAKSGAVIGCCTEAGQAGVLEEEPGVRFRLVEPEFCRSCREEP